MPTFQTCQHVHTCQTGTLGFNGQDSTLKGPGVSLKAIGGGGGSDSYGHKAGRNGGSGGGAFDPPGAGGKGVAGQGHNGGTGKLGAHPQKDGSTYRMGGGGGAGGPGNTNHAGKTFQVCFILCLCI